MGIYNFSADNNVNENLISANLAYGIAVAGFAGNSISFNKIGVGANGETPLGNLATGIAIFGGSPFDLVESNVISANGGYGISVADTGTTDTVIESNKIGTDATGTEAFGNALTAISVFNGAETRIGEQGGQGSN